MSDTKVHLGDGAYVKHDGFYFWLSAERSCEDPGCPDEHQVENLVALEPEGLVSLVRYAVERRPALAVEIDRTISAVTE